MAGRTSKKVEGTENTVKTNTVKRSKDELFAARVGYTIRRAQALVKKSIKGATISIDIVDASTGAVKCNIVNKTGAALSRDLTLTGNGNNFYDVVKGYVDEIAAQVKAQAESAAAPADETTVGETPNAPVEG